MTSNRSKILVTCEIQPRLNSIKQYEARLEHGSSWLKFITEYKELITRIQSRYDETRTSCELDLKQRAFETVAYGDKLLNSDLGEFFQACGMHPTEGEISNGFNSVFKGSGNTGELIFLLDCSSSIGKYNFLYLTSFVKDIISNFEIGPDRVRVGVIPFTDGIEHSFGITTYSTKQETLNAIDLLQPREGLTRTDLALKLMTNMLSASRPGVRKLSIVITDGKSSEPDLTKIAAKKAHNQSIEVFVVGVGKYVDIEELNVIASSEKHVLRANDYMSLRSLKENLTKSTCLDACVLCQTILPRIRNYGLCKNEAMDIFWSLYPPPGCRINYESSKEQRRLKCNDKTKCRPLNKVETMEIFWTVYPPSASNISKKSRWIRPIIEGTEAWTLLDKNIVNSTDIKTCLRLVIQSKIEREGHVMLPAKVRDGVQKVSNPDEAVMIVEEWIKEKQEKQLQNRENLLTRI
ncbi:hypothetical protein KUTeg_021896 [Tegillarca granosa]|uniref:VWFA domain-containing protein n=1 Tax=Tegillarca granosa TaxID=220873 RepID=A0ABQ9E919_TEGGR|nr:hypothetical protein KUTeg_021896 [Tegillarca granosa]